MEVRQQLITQTLCHASNQSTINITKPKIATGLWHNTCMELLGCVVAFGLITISQDSASFFTASTTAAVFSKQSRVENKDSIGMSNVHLCPIIENR